jgi:hypothetical protein
MNFVLETPLDTFELMWLGVGTIGCLAPSFKLRDFLGKGVNSVLMKLGIHETSDGSTAYRTGGDGGLACVKPLLGAGGAESMSARVDGGRLFALLEANRARHDSEVMCNRRRCPKAFQFARMRGEKSGV